MRAHNATERLGNHPFELLCATVVAALATHLAHLPLWLWLSIAIMLGLRVWTRRNGLLIGAAIRLPLTALLFVLVTVTFGNVFGREPGSVLGCGLLALKLLETERLRDARVALGFSAFVLMSALLFTQTLLFTVAICLVLILLVATLTSLQPAPIDHGHPLRSQLRLAALLLGAGLPLAATAFMLVPRLGSPLWGSPGNDSSARTGLSDRMAPGSMTELLIDDTPALRVDFIADVPPSLQRYFRAVVLQDFDGTTWTHNRSSGYSAAEELRAKGPLIDYMITLEPTQRRWLPALDMPLAAPETTHLGTDRTLMADAPVDQPRQYRVQSAPTYVLAPTLSAAQRSRALALPMGFDPQSRALAEGWRAQGLGENAIERAALDLFHAQFTYTLTPPLLGRDSVDDFMFVTRRGFCEHYASAFAFLMRSAGIPARVITGYQGGWWSKTNHYLLVRQSDAHAWVEVWHDASGWRRVDPTAAVSPLRVELGAAAANGNPGLMQSDWLHGLRNQLDVASRLWTEGIVRFDALRQKNLLTPFGVEHANQGDLLIALSVALGVLMVLATLWAIYNGSRQGGDALDKAWRRLALRLDRAGVSRRSNEGPLDLLQRARSTSPANAAALEPLVADYVSLRYGVDVPPRERIDAFMRAAQSVRLPHRPGER